MTVWLIYISLWLFFSLFAVLSNVTLNLTFVGLSSFVSLYACLESGFGSFVCLTFQKEMLQMWETKALAQGPRGPGTP